MSIGPFTTRSNGTQSHMLERMLHSGTSKTKQLVPVHVDPPLQFLKCHCATCVLAYVMLHHETGSYKEPITNSCRQLIVPLHISVTWYGINYAGTQTTQWDLKKEEKSGWTGKSSFLLKVPLRYLRSAQHNLFLTMLPDRAIKGPIV